MAHVVDRTSKTSVAIHDYVVTRERVHPTARYDTKAQRHQQYDTPGDRLDYSRYPLAYYYATAKYACRGARSRRRRKSFVRSTSKVCVSRRLADPTG